MKAEIIYTKPLCFFFFLQKNRVREKQKGMILKQRDNN